MIGTLGTSPSAGKPDHDSLGREVRVDVEKVKKSN
jgi:hypothetical protein